MSWSLRSVSSRLLAVGFGLSLLATSAQGALMSTSVSAPTINNADIAQFTGGVDLGGDEGHVWSDRPVQGQTFTTGANAGGYTLSAVTLQAHTGGFTNGSTSPNWNIRVGTVSGTTFTPLAAEAATGVAINANDYITWTFGIPIALAPNTVYGFDVGPSGGGFVSANTNNAAAYPNGAAYSSGDNAIGDNANVITRNGDRVFHVDLVNGAPVIPTSNGRISVNFSGGNNSTASPYGDQIVTGVAGVVPLANWNNVAGPSFGSPDVSNFALVDSDGSATTARFTMDIGNTWESGGPSATQNDIMMRSYIDNGQGQTIRVDSLDPRFTGPGYSVIVYYDTDSNGVFRIGATDNLGNTDAGWAHETTGNFAGVFLESTALTEADAIAAFGRGATSNFLTLTGFTGNSFTIQLLNGNNPAPNTDDRARISGFQIIANTIVPEPASAMLGLFGAMALGFRRRRAA